MNVRSYSDKKENYVYKGKLNAPKGEQTKDWKIREQLLFKSTA